MMGTITDKQKIYQIGQKLRSEILSECQHEQGTAGAVGVTSCTLSKISGIIGFLNALQEVPDDKLRAQGAELLDELENVLNEEMIKETWANF